MLKVYPDMIDAIVQTVKSKSHVLSLNIIIFK